MTEFFSVPELKSRGWTEASIRSLLGEPDKTKTNPIYRTGSPMRLFSEARVTDAEASEDFIDWKKKSERRRAAAVARAQSQRDKTCDWATTVKIHVRKLNRRNLEYLALKHYEDLWEERGCYEKTINTVAASEDFKKRISVNYLRHVATNYESLIDDSAGKVGTHEAYSIIRGRVLQAIAEEHEWLADECRARRDKHMDEIINSSDLATTAPCNHLSK